MNQDVFLRDSDRLSGKIDSVIWIIRSQVFEGCFSGYRRCYGMEDERRQVQQGSMGAPIMTNDTIAELFASQGRKRKPETTVYHDTSDFMNLEAGDVIILQDTVHLINRNERDSGLGMDDDPKYWVKRTTDLKSGKTKIVKLAFFEEFQQNLGGFDVRFFRSPEKEAKVLDLVSGHPNFMHGTWLTDSVGNNVRVIDFIAGPSLVQMISLIDRSHEGYFRQNLPKILPGLLECLDSLSLLHDNNLVHGDVHWNHILWDRNIEKYRWIDFDYAYNFPENPFGVDLIGIGKLLANVIGQGPRYYGDIKNDNKFMHLAGDLVPEDFSIIEGNQLMNLKKIYPYLPDCLNNILLHFSGHAEVFYESIGEITTDLWEALTEIPFQITNGEKHN